MGLGRRGVLGVGAGMWLAALGAACDPPARPVGCDAHDGGGDADGGAENLLWVVLDDVGVDKVGGWGLHPLAPATPHLDALAAQGVRFGRAYAEPSCSPTRAALLTGRHPSRTGIGTWIDLREEGFTLPDGEVTLPEALLQAPASWSTAAFGKWHLSGARGRDPWWDPNRQGFDHFAGILGNPNMSTRGGERSRGHEYWEYVVDGRRGFDERWLTTAQVDDALAWIPTMSEPWFVYVALSAAHSPWTVPPGVEAGVGDAARYDAIVGHLDAEVGRLLDGLGEALLGRTTVVVVSDNGTPEEVITAPWDPARSKETLYEAGVRVPLIITGPRVAAPGSSVDSPVHVVDLFATALDIAGVAADELRDASGAAVVTDGRSLLPLLEDPVGAEGRACVMVERFGVNGAPGAGRAERAVVGVADKLWWGGDAWSLRVTEDPSGEVFVEEQDAELRRTLTEYRRQLGW